MGTLLAASYYNSEPQCSESLLSDTASPDGRWNAAVMERRCGGEGAPYYAHVNLRAVGKSIFHSQITGMSQQGEVFVAEEVVSDIPELEWTSPGQLVIHCPRCPKQSVQKRDERWGPIALRYQLQP
jgi:hypothetical protein